MQTRRTRKDARRPRSTLSGVEPDWFLQRVALDAGNLSTAHPVNGSWNLDCSRAVFLFTAHVDTSAILSELERRGLEVRPHRADDVRRSHLRRSILPELLGRIDAFLVFRPLSERTRAEILALSVIRIAAEYGLTVVRVAVAVNPAKEFRDWVKPQQRLSKLDDSPGS